MAGDKPKEQKYHYDSVEPDQTAPRKSSPVPNQVPSAPVGLLRPRLKHATTAGQSVPSGSTLAPPKPTPLPARGSGLVLFLNVTAAVIALIFAVLLALKL